MPSCRSLLVVVFFIVSLSLAAPRGAAAQAACVDATGDMCLNVVRAGMADGVVEDVFQTSDGRYAPDITFASLIRGVNGCIGQTHTPTILTGYTCCTPPCGAPGGDDPTFHANDLDWYWTQVIRTRVGGAAVADGEAGSYFPWTGRIYDLGGEGNRVVLFPITDHAPLPCEAFEYTVWLSNDPNATTIAPVTAPDPRQWNPARLIRVFTQGWTRNPAATSTARGRPDLATYLRDASAGDAVADALATVWALPCGISFRYVAIQAGNEGNPGPECVYHSSDDELDAIAGLNEDDTAICVDADGDGHRDAACGGSDCDDTDPSVHPGAFEPCNATRDYDCLPALPCPAGTTCDEMSGLCVPQCFEGGCAPGFSCVADRCVDPACADWPEPCPAGTLCRAGECVEPCAGVVCPSGQICAGGACIDPCAGVVCPANQVCVADDPDALTVCGPACTCTELTVPLCPSDEACDARMGSPTFGECVDPGCETATCAPTQVCVGGTCTDRCEGVVCPGGQICLDGECAPDLCSRVVCPTGLVCRGGECLEPCTGVTCDPGMICVDGACVADPCAGVDCGVDFHCIAGVCVPGAADGGGGGTADGGPRGPGSSEPGCACRAGGSRENGSGRGALAVALVALIAGCLRRRRR